MTEEEKEGAKTDTVRYLPGDFYFPPVFSAPPMKNCADVDLEAKIKCEMIETGSIDYHEIPAGEIDKVDAATEVSVTEKIDECEQNADSNGQREANDERETKSDPQV